MTTTEPIRAEVRYFGGTGHRERFTDWAALAEWLASPEFTEASHRVRTLTVVAPNPLRPLDPDAGQPRPRQDRVPAWLGVYLSPGKGA